MDQQTAGKIAGSQQHNGRARGKSRKLEVISGGYRRREGEKNKMSLLASDETSD